MAKRIDNPTRHKNEYLQPFIDISLKIFDRFPYGIGYLVTLSALLWFVISFLLTIHSISRLSEDGKYVVRNECSEVDYVSGRHQCSENSHEWQQPVMSQIVDDIVFAGKLALGYLLIRLVILPISLANERFDDAYRENFHYCSPWIKKIMEILHLRDKSE